MFIYKKPVYDSESDDSDSGARCCSSLNCPAEKPAQLDNLTYIAFVPPPDLDTAVNGYTKTGTALTAATGEATVVNIDIPNNGANIPFGAFFSAPIGWQFEWYIGFSQDELDTAMYDIDTVTTNATVNGFTISQNNITVQKLQPGDLPFTWNGVEIFSNTANVYAITVFPLEDTNGLLGLNDLVQCSVTADLTLSYTPNANCDQYEMSFDGSVQQTNNPIALYKVSATPMQGTKPWYENGPAGDFATCEQFLTANGQVGWDNADPNIDYVIITAKHNVNQAWWDANHPGFVPDKLTITLEQKGLTNWQNAAWDNSVYPANEKGYKANDGTLYQADFLTGPQPSNRAWPIITDAAAIPNPDQKSLFYDSNDINEFFENGEAFFKLYWVPDRYTQGTFAFLYRWEDTGNPSYPNQIIHFAGIRLGKGIPTRTTSLILPVNTCWNSTQNYYFPNPADWATTTTQLYTTPQHTSIWYPEARDAYSAGANFCPTQTRWTGQNPANKRTGWQMFWKGSAPESTYYVQMPFFFDGTNTTIEFGETDYVSRDEATTYTGSPRNVTWSVCDPAGGGSIANGQFTILQDNASFTRDLASGGTGLANCQGLMYIRLNLNSFPGGGGSDTTGVQWFQHMKTRLPTDCYLKTINAFEFGDPDFEGGAFGPILGTSVTVTKTLTLLLDDNYEGDYGRSVCLHHFADSATPLRFVTIRNPEDTADFVLRSAVVSTYFSTNITNVRDYFNPLTNELTLKFVNTNARFVLGLSYLAKTVAPPP